MNLKKLISPVLMAALAAGSFVPAATAGEWHHRNNGGNRATIYQNNSGYGYSQRVYRDDDDNYGEHHRGRGLAIGAVAAILGLAIVAGSHRNHNEDYYEDRD